MCEDLLWQRQPGAQQQRRPVQAVKPNDLLADQVELRRPEALERLVVVGVANTRQIIGQCVDPHVDHFVRRAWHRDAPAHQAAARRKISQPLPDYPQDFVTTRRWLDEIGLAHQPLQRILVARQAEEPVFLGDVVARQSVDGAISSKQLVWLVVGLTAWAVGPFVHAAIQVTAGFQALP